MDEVPRCKQGAMRKQPHGCNHAPECHCEPVRRLVWQSVLLREALTPLGVSLE